MNRALAAAVRGQESLHPGDLDRALREGRVTVSITVEPAQDPAAA
jgi:hypothetical protein